MRTFNDNQNFVTFDDRTSVLRVKGSTGVASFTQNDYEMYMRNGVWHYDIEDDVFGASVARIATIKAAGHLMDVAEEMLEKFNARHR
jgi:hypothetical protein